MCTVPTAGGLMACYIAGLEFFRYTLVGDLAFAAAAFGAYEWLTRTAGDSVRDPKEVPGMKIAAIIEYLQDKETVERLRPIHRQYLASLKEKGQFAISGPFADGSGALIVYEAESAAAAEARSRSRPISRQRRLSPLAVAAVEHGHRQLGIVSRVKQ